MTSLSSSLLYFRLLSSTSPTRILQLDASLEECTRLRRAVKIALQSFEYHGQAILRLPGVSTTHWVGSAGGEVLRLPRVSATGKPSCENHKG